jgi:tetratricopeptide (TPR) repeat protein
VKRLNNTLWIGLAWCLNAANAAPSDVQRHDQAVEVQRAGQQNIATDAPPRADTEALPQPESLTVDERPLWQLREQGRDEELRREIDFLREAYPDWQPPPTLLQVDERPLWRLREQGKHAQLQREIQRLRSAYPDWTPSAALLQVDERPLWRLREQGKHAQLQREIQQLRSAYPDWTPSAALLQVDERPLWRLHDAGRREALQEAVVELRGIYPDWQPPAALTRTPPDEGGREALETAMARGDHAGILRQAAAHPALFQCRRVDYIWALADIWSARGELDRVFGLYRYVMLQCNDAGHRLTTLQTAAGVLPPQQYDRLLALAQERGGLDREQQALLGDLLYGRQRDLLQDGDGRLNEDLLQELTTRIIERRDTATALSVAWARFDQGDHEAAATWFARARDWAPDDPDAAYGLALSRFQQGRLDEAEALLDTSTAPRSRALLAQLYLRRAALASERADPSSSNQWLDRAAAIAPPGRDQTLLRAWNDHALGHDDAAFAGFRAAYDADPDDAAADGMVSSMVRADRWDDMSELAVDLGDPLLARWHDAVSDRLAQRGLYRAAHAVSPDNQPDWHNLDSPSLILGAAIREKRGDAGTSRLSIRHLPMAGAEWDREGERFGLDLARVDLDSGQLDRNIPFGRFMPGSDRVAEPVTRLSGGLEPRLWWQREGWVSWSAELGMTPSGAPLSSALLGSLSRLQQTDGGHWRATLFVRPLRESLLSYVGAVDPYSGQPWGRVRKFGGELAVYQALTPDWGLSADLEAAHYEGDGVADNAGMSASLGLGYALGLDGFDYFTLGPRLSYQVFDENLNHFTYGHGGYFSPQGRFAAGLAAVFQRQGGDYALRGQLYAGWATQHEGAGPCFPLGGASPTNGPCTTGYAAVDTRGVEANGYVAVAVRLSGHGQLLFGLTARDGADYQDATVLAGVRFTLDPRPSVLSADLPESWLKSLF